MAEKVFPPLPANSKQNGAVSSHLYGGSKFQGFQDIEGLMYRVEVHIKYVDEENNYLCGDLIIHDFKNDGEYITLSMFFDGEIISKKYPFRTQKWMTDARLDANHWCKFPAFIKYLYTHDSENFDYGILKSTDHVFMRWKLNRADFMTPHNPIVEELADKLFTGFYYICFTKSKAYIDGHFYQFNSHKLQYHITLGHVRQRGLPVYQFR